MGQNTVTTVIRVDSAAAIAQFKNLGSSITMATAAGNLLADGIGKGLSVAAAGVGKVLSGFKEVAAQQSANIGTAGDFARLSGLSFSQAQEQVSSFGERMGVVSAGLSGDNALYRDIGLGITDNLVPAFLDAQGAFDSIDFNKTLDDITTSAGFRAAQAGLEAKDAALAVSKALSGKSMAELSTLQFFEASPAALAFMEKEAQKIGKELKDMTATERASVVSAALKVPPEVIAAAQDSVDGLLESFKASLFDENNGVFGKLRDLDLNKEGNQSAFQSYTRIIQKIFGENGLVAMGSKLLNNLGLSADPMALLAKGLGKVGAWIDRANKWLSGALGATEQGNGLDRSALMGALGNLPSKLGSWLASQANRMFSALGGMDTAAAGQGLGKALAAGINMVTNYIANLDVQAIGRAFLNVAIVAAEGAVGAVRGIQWGPMAEAILTMGLVAATGMGAGALAGFVGLTGAAAAGFIAAGVGIVAAVQGLSGVAASAIASIGSAISNVFAGIAEQVRSMASSVFSGNTNRAAGQGPTRMKNFATGLDQGGLFAALRKESRSMPSGAMPVLANSSELIMPKAEQAWLAGALGNRGGGASFAISGGIHVHGADAQNPKAAAKAVMREIESEWMKFSSSQIAPNY